MYVFVLNCCVAGEFFKFSDISLSLDAILL